MIMRAILTILFLTLAYYQEYPPFKLALTGIAIIWAIRTLAAINEYFSDRQEFINSLKK